MQFLKNKLTPELISYLVFGVMTTVVNIAVFYVFNNILNIHYLIANIIAWALSVIFAYFTNKIFVFKASDVKGKDQLKEFLLFVSARVISFLFDEGGMFVMISLMGINDNIAKIIVQFIVVVLNYLFSKMVVFKK